MDTDIPTLDLACIQAEVGCDSNGQPTIEITDGTTKITLVGDDRRESFRGSARLRSTIVSYQEQLAAS